MEATPLKSQSKTNPSLAPATAKAPQTLSSLPRRVLVEGRRKNFKKSPTYTKPTAKSPLVFSPKFAGKSSPQLFQKDAGYGHRPKAKENPEATENLLPASDGINVHSLTCTTPIKTAFNTPSKLQTPSSKIVPFSARDNIGCPQSAAGGPNENENSAHSSITRLPLRLLAQRNLAMRLFSPLSTSLVASPAALEKLGSPAIMGLPKRVLVLPPQLSSPARRVSVKKKGSHPRIKPSSFTTPKSCRTGEKRKGPCQNDDDDVKQTGKNLEGLLKRVLVLPSQLSSSPARRVPVQHKGSQLRTPKSRRTGERRKGPCQNDDDVVDDDDGGGGLGDDVKATS